MTTAAGCARRNGVLDGLSDDELAVLLPDLEEVSLPLGRVLHEPGRRIDEVYFPISGVVSVVAELDGDQIVEAATIGKEGMAGLAAFLGTGAPTERALVQVPGAALRMPAARFAQALAAEDGALTGALRRCTQAMLTQLRPPAPARRPSGGGCRRRPPTVSSAGSTTSTRRPGCRRSRRAGWTASRSSRWPPDRWRWTTEGRRPCRTRRAAASTSAPAWAA